MRQLLGKFAVVRQQQQAFRLAVEPADGEQPSKPFRQKLIDQLPRMFVLRGARVSRRFVEHDIDQLFWRFQHTAFEFHDIAPWIDIIRRRQNRLVIDRDPPFQYHLFTATTRSDARRSHEFRKSYFIVIRHRCLLHSVISFRFFHFAFRQLPCLAVKVETD